MAAVGIKMEGFEKLAASFRNLNKKFVTTDLAIGFSAKHATRIHEDLEMRHPNGGQAKYLEQPMREMSPMIPGNIRNSMASPEVTLPDAMLIEGQKVLDAAKAIVPVDSGELRDSGYVTVRSQLPVAA